MHKCILLISCFFYWVTGSCQLPNGANAPDFDVQDLNGNTFSLYAMMGSNKSACLDFSATWCGPCWSFHQSKVLEQVYNNLSANTTVIMLEADWNTNTACLYGPSGCNNTTQGNWVAGTPYPIANLSSTNGPSVRTAYDINYFPTLYVISPDKRVWEIVARTYQNYVNWITKSFTLSATSTLTNSSCGDNGKIIMNVTGGYSTIYYKWSNGATTKDLNNIPGGTYSVTISDVNGYFKEYGPYVITGPSKRVDIVSSNLVHIKCFNDASGSIGVQTDYGTAPYFYNWSNGANSSVNDYLKAGSYKLTVTDFVGCTNTKSYVLNQPTDLKLTATSGKENCSDLDGYIQAKALGGIPPYLYDIGFGNQQSPYFSDLPGGKDYTVTVTDQNDCEETVNTYVDVTTRPKADAGSEKSIDCIQESISLDGSQSDKGSNYEIIWTTKNGNILKGEESLLPEVNKAGKYFLKVTDVSNKCFDIDSVLVLDKSVFPNISAVGDTTLHCKLNQTTLSGSSKNLPVKFFWKKMADTIFLKEGKNIEVSDSGYFILHVNDTINLCISRDTVIVSKDIQLPTAIANAEKNLSCTNTEILLDGTSSTQGSEFQYFWNTSNGYILSGEKTLIPLVNKAGDYELEVENKINFCKSIATVELLEQTFPSAIFEQSIQTFTAQFTDKSSGIPSSWNWNFGDGTQSVLQHPIHVFPSEGEYEVCLTIDNDCGQNTRCQKILVGISSALTLVSSTVKPVSCFEGNDGFINLTIQGGIPPYVFLWSNQQTSKDLFDVPVGTYTVQIKDQQGTSLELEFTIEGADELIINKSSVLHTPTGKSEGTVSMEIAGGTSPYNYLWSNGMTTNPIADLAAGDYYCTLTDENSCQREFGPFTVKEITATSQYQKIKRFEVNPNPIRSNGNIFVQLDKQRFFTLSIVNVLGERIWMNSTRAESRNILVNLEDYPKGIYFVVLTTENSQQVLKWILN